jgi:hypothetical protein
MEPFKDDGGNAGCLLVEPAREITQQPLSFVGIVEFSSALRSLNSSDQAAETEPTKK